MKHYILFYTFLVFQLSSAQTTFKADDLNGQWLSTKPGAELVLDIQQNQATIVSLGKSTLTKSLIGGNMYESITYEGNGVWKAQRNSWRYNGVGGNNSDSGRWEKGPKLTLTLSKDKNMLSASGHWSYKRVIKVIEDNSSVKTSRSVLIEDFGGVTGKFILGELTNKNIIVAQVTNTTSDQSATITITHGNGREEVFNLNPGNTITKKFDTKKIKTKVEYKEANTSGHQINITNSIKKTVGKMILNENGNLKSESLTVTGVRG